jgi:hypothetical protein
MLARTCRKCIAHADTQQAESVQVEQRAAIDEDPQFRMFRSGAKQRVDPPEADGDKERRDDAGEAKEESCKHTQQDDCIRMSEPVQRHTIVWRENAVDPTAECQQHDREQQPHTNHRWQQFSHFAVGRRSHRMQHTRVATTSSLK